MTRLFPTSAEMLAAEMTAIGMPRKRKETLRHLAQAIVSGSLQLDTIGELSRFVDAMTSIPGIGEWTANYVAMRALGEPDAFPASDLGIMKALQMGDTRPTVKQVMTRADAWRPWRAYAAIYLWLA